MEEQTLSSTEVEVKVEATYTAKAKFGWERARWEGGAGTARGCEVT